jgi:hypothetical protein
MADPLPQPGETVNFVLQGGVRTATIRKPWDLANVPLLARKLGVSEEEVLAAHSMRATVEIQTQPEDGLPIPFTVSNAEYDASSQRVGTWHRPPAPDLFPAE